MARRVLRLFAARPGPLRKEGNRTRSGTTPTKAYNRSAGGIRQMPRSLVKLTQVAALLVVAITLAALPAMSGFSAVEMNNCSDQDWCLYLRVANSVWRLRLYVMVNICN